MLVQRDSLWKSIGEKWRHERRINFPIDWRELWKLEQGKKEGGFMWSLWHQAVATNSWQGRINTKIDHSCPMCPSALRVTYTQRFYDCEQAKIAWHFCFDLMHKIHKDRRNMNPPRVFTFEQCVNVCLVGKPNFAVQVPRNYGR